MRLFCLVLLGLFCFSAPAGAQELDAKGALLKSQIGEILKARQDALKLSGGELKMQGDIAVEKAGGYYAVTLPHLTAQQEDGNKVEIGMIALNAVPGKEDGEWKISVALPTPILWMDKDGKKQKQLRFGKQKFSGNWSPALRNFSQLDALYQDVEIDYIDEPEALRLGSLGLTSDLKADKDDLWSGPVRIFLSDLKIGEKDKAPSFKADKINIALGLNGFSPDKYKNVREKIDAYTENSGPEDLIGMGGDERAAFFDMIVELIKSSGKAFTLSLGAENLFSEHKAHTTKVDKGILTLAFTDLDSDKMSFKLSQQAQTISLKNGTEDVSGLTPKDMKVNINLENVPMDGLLGLLRSNLSVSGTDNQTARQLARIQTMMLLPQLFSQAGSTVSIQDTSLKNHLYDADAYGQIKANEAAALGMAGEFTISLAGLDEMIKTMKENKKSVDIARQLLADKTIQRLTLLSALGQESKTQDGKPARLYKFEIKESGEVLLNGTDFSVLMKND